MVQDQDKETTVVQEEECAGVECAGLFIGFFLVVVSQGSKCGGKESLSGKASSKRAKQTPQTLQHQTLSTTTDESTHDSIDELSSTDALSHHLYTPQPAVQR